MRIAIERITILVAMFAISGIAFADEAYNTFPGPQLYEGSYQDGRNICLGFILSNPGIPGFYRDYRTGQLPIYAIGRISELKEEAGMEEVFKGRFQIKEADASILSARSPGDPEYKMYLYIIPDVCVPDDGEKYYYFVYNESASPYCSIGIEYHATGLECENEGADICADMDLTEFFSWAIEKKEEKEEEDACGCSTSGAGDFSFPLALGMVLIGIVALAIARMRSKY